MNRIIPLKRFGQNYLQDRNIIGRITETIAPKEDEQILEIGPGQGSLTGEILKSGARLTAVEIDKRVIEDLAFRFPMLRLIQGDFLKISLESLGLTPGFKIAGNIPYNLTSPIIFKLIRERSWVKECTLMVQYEVAKRMTGHKGTKDYGILRILLMYFTETEFCFKVPPTAFYPRPNVDSAVVKMKFKKTKDAPVEDEWFIAAVKAAFSNRRKTLKNSLSNSIFKAIDFSLLDLDLTKRAEEFDIPDFIKLAQYIENEIRKNKSQN